MDGVKKNSVKSVIFWFVLAAFSGFILLSVVRMYLASKGDAYYKQGNFQKASKYYSIFQPEMADLIRKTHPFCFLGDGEVVTFGRYEQDGDEENGREPIEWTIMTKEENKVLLISKNILECMPFEKESDDSMGWHVSTLRDWMNDEFYFISFSPEERSRIKPYNSKSEKFDTNGAEQNVFLLDLFNMEKIYDISYHTTSDLSRPHSDVSGIQTEYIEQKYPKNEGRWWVDNSFKDGDGFLMNGDGSLGTGDCRDADVGVRPMIWVEQ